MSTEADYSSDSEVEFLESVEQTQNLSSSSPPPIQTIFESVQKSNINQNIKADIIKFLNEAVDAKTKLQIYRQRLHQQSQTKTTTSSAEHQATVPTFFTTSTPLRRSTSNPEFGIQVSPIPRHTRPSTPPVLTTTTILNQQTTVMGQPTLTATDITQIQDIINQSVGQNDTRLRTFTGNPEDAVSWLEDFQCLAESNNWNDDRKRTKLGIYLSNAGREWYSLEISGTQKTWQEIKDSFFEQFLPVDYQSHIRNEFRNRKQKLFEPSANFITSMRSLLKKVNQQIPEADAVEVILQNMLPDIVEKVMLLNPKTFAELKDKSNLVERTLKAARAAESQLMAIAEGNARRRPRCFHCRKIGHVKADCWFLNRDLNLIDAEEEPEQEIVILSDQ